MKRKKEDKMLRELFRQKLENAEVFPSQAAGEQLMRRLAGREFLRFNPGRFNIWYATVIAVSGLALAIALFSGSKTDNIESLSLPESEGPLLIYQNLKSGKVRDDFKAADHSQGVSSMRVKSEGSDTRDSYEGIKETTREMITGSVLPGTLQKDELPRKSLTEKNILQASTIAYDNYIEASQYEGCAPLRVQFRNIAGDCDSCTWDFGDGGSSVIKDPAWLFDIPGEYNVTLTQYGPGKSRVTSLAAIKVYPRPVARFEISPDDISYSDKGLTFHNYSSDAVRFRWDFGDGEGSDMYDPGYVYNKHGNYNVRLIAYSEFGCTDTLTIMNPFSGSGFYIDFPNAFIPNRNGPSGGYYSSRSDEVSHVFHPVFSGVSDYQLRIFSRRGILIFESNDINIGWDGYYKGQLSDPGIYIWKVRGSYLNGEPFTRMGDLTLFKN